jgi:hypothetical protein
MTAHVAYPALDPSGAIATFSRPVVDRLRAMADDADISVAVFTDALLMAGAATPGGEVEAARRALAAGCDALLIPENPERLADELLGDGTGDADLRVDLAAARLRALADLVEELASSPARTDDPLRLVAPRVADRAVRAAGLQDLDPLSPGDLVVLLDDDDLPSRGEVLARRVRGAGVEVRTVRVPRGGPVPAGLDRLDPRVVVVFSSVRAWKGAHDLSPSGREALDLLARKGAKVVALAPRGEGAHFLVPGTGPDVEASVADVLLGE